MGALPRPASLEKTPLATPILMASHTPPPAKPPTTAPGEGVQEIISHRAGIILWLFMARDAIPARRLAATAEGHQGPPRRRRQRARDEEGCNAGRVPSQPSKLTPLWCARTWNAPS